MTDLMNFVRKRTIRSKLSLAIREAMNDPGRPAGVRSCTSRDVRRFVRGRLVAIGCVPSAKNTSRMRDRNHGRDKFAISPDWRRQKEACPGMIRVALTAGLSFYHGYWEGSRVGTASGGIA